MPVTDSQLDELVQQALRVRERAHAPYSRFYVGAALLASSGAVYVGCNVENASFSLTICAERVAAGTAITRGDHQWFAVAVASDGGVTPCGACRQFLAEFGNDLIVLCVDANNGKVTRYQLSALLPHAFDASKLPPETTTGH